jgi:hypothetical protein
MTRITNEVQLGTLLNNLLLQLTKEKHFCHHCFSISEETDSRGDCIACGAPFGEEVI